MYQEYLNQLKVSIAPLTSDELKELLNNDERLEEKIDNVLEELKTHKNNLCEVNRTKAEQNIEKEPKISELRCKITDLLQEGRQSCETVQSKLAIIKEKSGSVSQETALALLQTAAAESEEETESIFKKFAENELNVEAFLDEFLTARKTMHLRKLKAEKMQELVRRQAQQQQRAADMGGNMPGPAYSNIPGSGFFPRPYPAAGHSAGVPYPINPMMPMPPTPHRPL